MRSWNLDPEFLRTVRQVLLALIAAWTLASFSVTVDGFELERRHGSPSASVEQCRTMEREAGSVRG